MTTRYHLPDGATSVSADGLTFEGDENGHIDLVGAHPTTVATLVTFAGIKPVRTEEDLAQEAADAAEKLRFDAAVAEMMRGDKTAAAGQVDAVQAAQDLEAATEAAAKEAATTERTAREAMLAAAPVEAVTEPEEAEIEVAADSRAVLPPKRRQAAAKNA